MANTTISQIQFENNGQLLDIKPLVDYIYPIGAVYVSTILVDPALLFGGEWNQIQGKFLLSADETYEAGTTGGSATVTLETNNLPSHSHSIGAHAHSLNNHTHTGPSHTHTYDKSSTTTGGNNGATSGPSTNTSGGPSNNTSGGNNGATAGPSNNTSGSTAISVAQMPSHNHGSAGEHYHFVGDNPNNESGNQGFPLGYVLNASHVSSRGWWVGTSNAGAHTHSSNGSGSGHTHTLSSHTHTMSSHTHTLSSHTHTLSSHTHTMSSHTHTISLSSTNTGASGTGATGGPSTTNTGNSTAFDSGATGSGTAHNNMPPYLAVYMWERVA